MNHSTHPFDLVIGLDRSDRKPISSSSTRARARRRAQTIAPRPKRCTTGSANCASNIPSARVAICLEQPAASLILFLETYDWITLYAINPITLQKFREAFVTSRAKDDGKDAQLSGRAALHAITTN